MKLLRRSTGGLCLLSLSLNTYCYGTSRAISTAHIHPSGTLGASPRIDIPVVQQL